MPEKIDLFEAIDTQRGIRYFKPDPVPDELINRLLQTKPYKNIITSI